MKRIDLHIHTLSSPLDDEFEFSKETLRQHVERNALSAIAITNHNLFDFDNYKEVCSVFPEGVCVLPGIEVSVKGFHVLVIASPSDAEEFNRLCQEVPQIKQDEEGLAIERF